MNIRRFLAALVVLNLVLLVFLLAETSRASAQVFRQPQAVEPTVLSGSDFGFRVTGTQGDTVTGSLVVRVDGKWIAAKFAGGPLTVIP